MVLRNDLRYDRIFLNVPGVSDCAKICANSPRCFTAQYSHLDGNCFLSKTPSKCSPIADPKADPKADPIADLKAEPKAEPKAKIRRREFEEGSGEESSGEDSENLIGNFYTQISCIRCKSIFCFYSFFKF